MDKKFVHLHLHTDYSLLDAATQIKPLSNRLAELGMPACAITDHGNMYGAISFYHAIKAKNIKPIIGCEVYFTRGSRFDRTAKVSAAGEKINHHLILLAKNYQGYSNLVRLTSKAYTEGFYYKPRIDMELLAKHGEGLIGLSDCMSGVPSALLARGAFDEAVKATHEFQDVLGRGNYFLEIQDHELEMQQRIRKSLIELSRKTEVPLVATNDVHYLHPEDARAHDLLLCIGSGKTVNDANRLRYGSPYFYLRTQEEMWQLFGAELPDALERTHEIAEMCDIQMPEGVNYVPVFPIPESDKNLCEAEYFEKVVREGYEWRRASVWERLAARGDLRHSTAEYQERVSSEIAMIKRMGFASYFLIVWDIVRYAREHNVPVGPGRGSAAGSLVAYCLGITDVDPLEYDLLFERFLNPERVTMPDIDIDFCVRGRDAVIRHVAELYGRDSVCQIITFGTMASKAAIKDVGRALDVPYAEVERIAKMIPPPVRGRNVSITQALEQVPELRESIKQSGQVEDLINLARRLEGCARHASVHAAGVVISPTPLDELIPVAVSSKSDLTTQYAMSDLEKTGVLKMDFLALTALTIISDCLNSIKQMHQRQIDWSTVPLDDAAAMQLFADGHTEAIFQFESTGMQEICRRLKPKRLEDLAALNALYRPGPLDGGMVDDYIERHHGHKSARYIVPEMKELLSNTYGIIVYQEQIMQLAQKLAGFTLGEADIMRRAMGKKKREEMARQQEKFVSGAVERNIKKEKAEQIFNLMEQFADYGFNRSHSVAYAYLAFQTAYLKAHYPEHFYAAVLSNELENSGKILKYANELKLKGVRLLPPDVNESGALFTPLQGAIRYGLAAIKGIGQASVEAIMEARQVGPFRSLFDFVERVNPRAVNKRVMEGLISSGAFDSLSKQERNPCLWRATLMNSVDAALAYGVRTQRSLSAGQDNLFGGTTADSARVEGQLSEAAAWTQGALLAAEKSSIGFYITSHPLEDYVSVLSQVNACKCISTGKMENGSQITLGGVVTELQVRTTKKNDRFALLRLEDETGGLKCVVWPNVFSKYGKFISDDQVVLVSGRLEVSEEGMASLIADGVERLDEALQRRARSIVVRLPERAGVEQTLDSVFNLFNEHKGDCEVLIEMRLSDGLLVRARPHVALRVGGSLALESSLIKAGCRVEWINGNAGRSNASLKFAV